MRSLILYLISGLVAIAADDSWTKVRELKSGTEVRIYKKGAKQPLLAQFDEANDERLAVIVKNEQTAIPKDQIDRLDYRPAKSGGRVTKENKTTSGVENKPMTPGMSQAAGGPSTSTSSSMTINSKPDFETIYRRTATRTDAP